MEFNPLISEEDEKMANSVLSTQILFGVYPSEKYINKIKKKFKSPKDLELPNKILEQDKNIIIASNQNFEKSQEINTHLDENIKKVENQLNLIESSFIYNEDTGGSLCLLDGDVCQIFYSPNI